MISKIPALLVDLLYPRRCPVCDTILRRREYPVCMACRKKLVWIKQPFCMKCGKPLKDEPEKEYCYDCSHKSHYYDRGQAVFEYSCIKGSLYRFKYSGRQEYAGFYAHAAYRQMGNEFWKKNIDALIPVPLSAKRLRKRGYNQAELIAAQLSRLCGVKTYPDLVVRVRDTVAQKKLNDIQRQNNLKKAFKISQNDVKLNTIIIIDDIYTTGSTIDEIAKLFRQTGTKQIFFITIAIGAGM